MIALQLIGFIALIAASLILGVRLLRLAQRTRQVPELAVGLAFLLGGGLGYIFWLGFEAAMLQGASPVLQKVLILAGFACICGSAVANGVGTASIFRAGRKWPYLLIASFSVALVLCWVDLLRNPITALPTGLWYGMAVGAIPFLWGSLESLVVSRSLHRRARLGMADPQIVSRTAQWGIACACCVMLAAVGFTAGLAYGPVQPPWVGTLEASFGMLSAVAIWLGFFPPEGYRARLARMYGS